MKLESKTIHWGDRRKVDGGFTPVTTPIYTAASYVYDSMEQLDRIFDMQEDGPSYARYDNPTRNALEELVRELESGAGAVACSSGMAAFHLALLAALTDRPKRVVAANMLYGANTGMLMNIFGPLGFDIEFVDICDLAAIERALTEKTGAVVMETISNPLLRVGPLDEIAKLTKAADVPLIVDSTFTTPVLCRPLELGANIVVHSATKYMSGHGDVLGGVLIADQQYYNAARIISRTLGPVLGPFESYLTMRGIKTMALRVERQCANACRVAAWLQGQPRVARVYSTSDPNHPDAATIARLYPKNMTGAMIAFELKDAARAEVFTFMEKLKMVVRATSLGDCHSMVLYPAMASHRDLSPKQRQRLGIGDNLIRLSIGIEAIDDIIEDLAQALE